MNINWTTDKLWYINKMEYYKLVKMNQLQPQTSGMKL